MKKKTTTTTHTHHNTETIHIKSEGKHKPNITVLVNSEEVAKQQVQGFMDFLREKAIVGLAVGFVVATQVQLVVKQWITSFLDPMTLLIFGTKLSQQTFTIDYHGRTAVFAWGQFIYVLLNFVVILFAIYVVVKVLKLDRLDADPKKDEKEDDKK